MDAEGRCGMVHLARLPGGALLIHQRSAWAPEVEEALKTGLSAPREVAAKRDGGRLRRRDRQGDVPGSGGVRVEHGAVALERGSRQRR
jgi:hypothetical protein